MIPLFGCLGIQIDVSFVRLKKDTVRCFYKFGFLINRVYMFYEGMYIYDVDFAVGQRFDIYFRGYAIFACGIVTDKFVLERESYAV